ncbi:peptidase U32 family protein [Williamwhitmania taraxaci]|uniref:Protease n=1 Tax=Williamwhitmania taraxaci TaxID=1640674 RepID=A0A1G6GYQ4_9BACT|nr:peptidase U32 family protein [Williamwhitmania taraxaci]SDB87187.1 collagenase. Unknown type peptidase. MEROPS family U32 [Williamwhitmania taraxaci]
MLFQRNDIELMAPVGNRESLYAAIQGGANAVYFGVDVLNMRSRSANNFTLDELGEIVSICRENGLLSYLTVNTIVYEPELVLLKQVIDAAAVAGVSAIIASDQAAIVYAREKGIEVHISTQLSISNTESLKFYSGWADVVVLARELNMNQVAEISRQIALQKIVGPAGKPIKIEMFAHGALCMAISGKCYMSLHENNHSANRGACQQTCRKGYTVTEKETGYQLDVENEYIMSPKDLCTIGFLDKMIAAGVTVFKIEGRARSADYVKTVISCYREAIAAVADGTYRPEKIDDWMKRLGAVFNRGFWDGYYLGQKIGEWSTVYGSKATKRKVYLARVVNYFSKLGVAELLLEAGEISIGDEYIIIGPTSGVVEGVAEEIHDGNGPISSAGKGTVFSVKVGSPVRRADRLYKLVSSED